MEGEEGIGVIGADATEVRKKMEYWRRGGMGTRRNARRREEMRGVGLEREQGK